MKRISRKTKKTMRALLLCWTGNSKFKKAKIAQSVWIYHFNTKQVWFRLFCKAERKTANSIK